MISEQVAEKFGEIDLSKYTVSRLTPIQWCQSNRQWRRIDSIDHAKYQLGCPGSNKTFWKAVLDILGA